ncbi:MULTISPECIES: hypothetical protein [Cyanophyceae]|uniref:hypothetical protein n=1 Tax=Cyanophyceae TaxID=3028117 RepID=UPI0032207166
MVGRRSAKQVEGIIGAAEFRLSEDEINEIKTFLSKIFQQQNISAGRRVSNSSRTSHTYPPIPLGSAIWISWGLRFSC